MLVTREDNGFDIEAAKGEAVVLKARLAAVQLVVSHRLNKLNETPFDKLQNSKTPLVYVAMVHKELVRLIKDFTKITTSYDPNPIDDDFAQTWSALGIKKGKKPANSELGAMILSARFCQTKIEEVLCNRDLTIDDLPVSVASADLKLETVKDKKQAQSASGVLFNKI